MAYKAPLDGPNDCLLHKCGNRRISWFIWKPWCLSLQTPRYSDGYKNSGTPFVSSIVSFDDWWLKHVWLNKNKCINYKKVSNNWRYWNCYHISGSKFVNSFIFPMTMVTCWLNISKYNLCWENRFSSR